MKTQQTVIIVLAAILLLSIIGNIIYMTRSSRLADEKEQVTSERESLQHENRVLNETIEVKEATIEEQTQELEELTEKHDSLMTEKDAVIARLNRQANATASDLEAQEELNAELNAQINELEMDKAAVRDELHETRQELEALQGRYQQLTEKTEQEEKLRVYNMCVMTKWDRWLLSDRYNISKARRVDHTAIHFEVDGSVFTETGHKEIFLVLTDPDRNIMYEGTEQFTIHETGEESGYTAMEEIEYTNEPVLVEFNVMHPESLDAGVYKANIYVEGELSRSKEIILE